MKLSALRYLWAQIWIKELTQDLDQRAERQKDLEAQLLALHAQTQKGSSTRSLSSANAARSASIAQRSTSSSQQFAIVPPAAAASGSAAANERP